MPFQEAAFRNAHRVVELEQAHRDLANRSPPSDANPDQPEMFAPRIGARMEQADEFPAGFPDGADITALLAITAGAGERKVFGNSRPAVFFADDVIHLAADVSVRRVNEAILAEEMCAALDLPSQSRTDAATHEPDARVPEPWPDA